MGYEAWLDGGEAVIPATAPGRRIVTFYSYKGGVGRTMALANVAFRLADTHALRVLAVDWDLEAPGLHEFFGFDREAMRNARGVLDFLRDWQEAVKGGATAPPDVRSWFLPVLNQPYAPRHGSLALFPAGRMNRGYEARLARFSWRLFYKRYQGAMAIETLRQQLAESADIVLVDSRTGLTDAGGICTIQLPDGVVLMSAPNEQSLRGTERIAQGILEAGGLPRAERGAPTMWFSLSRISSVEETIGSSEWIARHEPWFERGVKVGLWKSEDHLNGLASHMIPFRARWSFGEQVLTGNGNVTHNDPLVEAYDQLTSTLLGWTMEASSFDLELRAFSEKLGFHESIDALRRRAAEAESRSDILQLRSALYRLGEVLKSQQRYDEAVELLERCAGLDLARGDRSAYGEDLRTIGDVRASQKRYDEAEALCKQALGVFRERGGNIGGEVTTLYTLGGIYKNQERIEEAKICYENALASSPTTGILRAVRAVLHNELGDLHRDQNSTEKARANYDQALRIYREMGASEGQRQTLMRLALMYHLQSSFDLALSFYVQALPFARKIKSDPSEGVLLEAIGGIYEYQGRRVEAKEHYKTAIAFFRNRNDSDAVARLQSKLDSLLARESSASDDHNEADPTQ